MHRLFLLPLLLLVFCLSAGTSDARMTWRRQAEPFYQEAFDALESGRKEPAYVALAQGSDPALNKVLKAYLMAQPGNDFSFEEMAAFLTENPDWPGLRGVRMIAEQKIPANAAAEQIARWFNAYPALTSAGFYHHMDALQAMGSARVARTLIRNKWIETNFSKNDLLAFRSRYGSLLTAKDHWARLDRLLWEEDSSAARQMYPYVTAGHKALAEARLSLAAGNRGASKLLEKVPASLQNDAGLLYERLRWRRLRNDTNGTIEILFKAPANLVRPEEWWKERHIIVRRLMEKKNFSLAYKLTAAHGLTPGFSYAQAEFLAGWLALRPLKNPALAETHFRHLIEATNFPVSQSRGYYWLGRALEAQGRASETAQAYETAAALDTTFYGQLAIAKLYAHPVLRAAQEPSIPSSVEDRFFKRDLIRAIEKLDELGQKNRAETYFRAALSYATQRVEFALLLDLSYKLQKPYWAVIAAKAANQKNFVLRGAAYPLLDLDIPAPPEVALTHALIRQESQFQTDAGSAAGARGLMQLMPATAKEVAKKLGIHYAPHKLHDPDYNLRLGTSFIQRQIEAFDGSYVLALAGYNAGPRRVREWMNTFGDPHAPSVDSVDWIELIPIYETRNYVQRIIENLQFYRARLNGGEAPLLILQDLKR